MIKSSRILACEILKRRAILIVILSSLEVSTIVEEETSESSDRWESKSFGEEDLKNSRKGSG